MHWRIDFASRGLTSCHKNSSCLSWKWSGTTQPGLLFYSIENWLFFFPSFPFSSSFSWVAFLKNISPLGFLIQLLLATTIPRSRWWLDKSIGNQLGTCSILKNHAEITHLLISCIDCFRTSIRIDYLLILYIFLILLCRYTVFIDRDV